MKVRDLIERLKYFDQDYDVQVKVFDMNDKTFTTSKDLTFEDEDIKINGLTKMLSICVVENTTIG